MTGFFKTVVVLLLCFLILLASFVTCFGAEVEFSLSDTETKKNRIFDVALNVENCSDVSAFICELEYDPAAIEYKSFSLNIENSDAQVNASEEGRLKAAFLCEESVSEEDKTSLVTFSFKALKAGEHNISLSVYDVINSEYEDLEAVCIPCVVNVAQIPLKDSSDSQSDNSDSNYAFDSEGVFEDSTAKEESGYTKIKGNDDNKFIFLGILSGLSLLAIVGYACYKLGVKSRKKVNNEK
ncbi:MAG: hypothetical protein E7566_07065 [Ruminococcaceae bacterium]|nr:hypothetical protein [Oscillospiraceae bacterium]